MTPDRRLMISPPRLVVAFALVQLAALLFHSAAAQADPPATIAPSLEAPPVEVPLTEAPAAEPPLAQLEAPIAPLPIAPVRPAALGAAERREAERLAAAVTIYRDNYGVPHVDGQSDAATMFGFAYAQAEDYFWQVEDNYLLSLGRYSEVHGPRGLNSDLLNRAFEIVPQAQATFARLEPELQAACRAFTLGLNYYLATHPEVQPRLITHFEPWQVLAFGRHMMLEMCFRRTGLSNSYLPRAHDLIWAASGSNGWAIAGSKTRSGHPMLLANPHLPWFGFAQLFEGHLRSASGLNFTGATTYGNPMLILGHNEQLGWTLTTNEPDIADLWRLTFDDPDHRLNYRYGDGYRTASERREVIAVRDGNSLAQRSYTIRKTHFGPVVAQEDDQTYLVARISGLDSAVMLRQTLAMARAHSLAQFRQALSLQQFAMMNIVYADRAGNIFYLYNGLVPKRDQQFDWTQPVDGADPQSEWQGLHPLQDLPQVLNPQCGYVQNCNSSPFTTCTTGSPAAEDFPRYLAEDAADDKRRAKRSREILDAMAGITLEDLQHAAYDTTVYWAVHELPKYAERLGPLRVGDPRLADEVAPYMKHLLAWDGRITPESTAATLAEAWYAELYGRSYPAETLRRQYLKDPIREFRALVKAATALTAIHGTWRVRWADVHRTQRQAQVADLLALSFDDHLPSLPCLGAPGPMGVIFTQYYVPSIKIPFVKTQKNQYALIGPTYLGVFEFGQQVRGATSLCFGSSGVPDSPHFADQAKLVSECRLKPELFDWNDIAAQAKARYHPGEARAE